MRNRLTILFVVFACLFAESAGVYASDQVKNPKHNAASYPALVYAAASKLAYNKDCCCSGQCQKSKFILNKNCLKIILRDELNRYILIEDNSDNSKGNFILSFRGSAVLKDWIYDVLGAFGAIPKFYIDAPDLTETVINKIKRYYPGYQGISLTGHSLGGGVAEYAARWHGLHAVTFNSTHLSHQVVSRGKPQIDAYIVPGDIAGLFRLGGSYDFTRYIDLGSKKYYSIIKPHGIDTVINILDKNKDISSPRQPIPLPENPASNLNDFEVLLESSPILLDGIPSILHNGMRVADIKNREREGRLPRMIVDTALRYGAIYDTAPQGGINIDSLRIFDLNQTRVIDADSDIARDWRAALSIAFPWPDNEKLTLVSTIDYQEIDYHFEDEFDFDVMDFNLGVVWHEDDGIKLGCLNADESISTLSLVLQRFRNEDDLVGILLGLDAATSFINADKKAMVWVHGIGGRLVKSDVPGGDGYVIQGDAGIRSLLGKTSSVQLRIFGGRREAENDIFTNTQWGTGLALYTTFKWCDCKINTLFIEPSIRWNHHHLDNSGGKRYADKEYSLHLAISRPFNCSLFCWGELRGWDISLGYTYSHNDAASSFQDYDRRQVLLHLDKKF